jgi:hypothetical protein
VSIAAGALKPGDLLVDGGLPEAECLGGRADAGVAGDDQQPVQATYWQDRREADEA